MATKNSRPSTTDLTDNYFKVPNGLHLILDNVYEYVAMSYLLRCRNEYNIAFPSYNAIAQGLMSRLQAIRSCKTLIEKGYIKIRKRKYKSNIFTIDLGKIVSDINQLRIETSNCEIPQKPKYSERQKDIMAEKRATKNPVIAHRAEFKNGYDVVKDGKVINNDITALNQSVKRDKIKTKEVK